MKKLICLMMILCSFLAIYAQEEYSEPDVVKELQEANEKLAQENEQLKKLIYESATVTINGNPVETKGLLSGFSLAYTKYKRARNKLLDSGNYVEIAGEEVLQFKDKTQELKEINVTVDALTKPVVNKDANNPVLEINMIYIYLMFAVIVILLIIFYATLRIKISSTEASLVDKNYEQHKHFNNDICSKMDKIQEKNEKLLYDSIKHTDAIIEHINCSFNKENNVIKNNFKTLRNVIVENNTSFIYSNIDGTNTLLRPDTKYLLLSNNINTLKDLNNTSEQKFKELGFSKTAIENIKQYLDEIGANLTEEDMNLTPDITLEDLEISARAKRCLRMENITTLEQLLNYKEVDLLHITGFGKKALHEIKWELKRLGLKFKDE